MGFGRICALEERMNSKVRRREEVAARMEEVLNKMEERASSGKLKTPSSQ